MIDAKQILALDAQHNSGLWAPNTILTHGKGIHIYDAGGKEYIDCLAGIAVASVGHANERLANAIAKQAKTLMSCLQSYANPQRSEFYQILSRFMPKELSRYYMANSGSEANESALKWAIVATGRHHFVSAKRGFSGRTMGVLALTWEKKYRQPFEPLRYDNDFIKYNSIEDLEKYITKETAAVLLEPIQGEGGINPASREFLEAARAITKERGALLIMDEIQTGVGRTGKFLASQHFDIKADMVTVAKGIAGGFPMSVLAMTDEVAQKMPKGGHGTTFGGNPLASAAATAVLQEIEERDLIKNAEIVGEYFKQELGAIKSDKIRAVRGKGLMIGVEFKTKVAPIIAKLKEEGVMTINAGATVIRFVPPLIISKKDVDEVVKRLKGVLDFV